MTTIAKTKKFQELQYRYLKLVQLYSVFSELRLHTNKTVNVETAGYYHTKLFTFGDYASFFTASLGSMRQVFYIELNGFIGVHWASEDRSINKRRYETGSLGHYLYDGKRINGKKKSKVKFEEMLDIEAGALNRLHDLRGVLSHFKKLDERNTQLVISDAETQRILNNIADILHLLGYQRWNEPYYYKFDSDASHSVQKLIDDLTEDDAKSKNMRIKYLQSRTQWHNS